MGWLGIFDGELTYRKGKVDRQAYLDKAFTWKSGEHSCAVVKSAMVGTTYYAAIRNDKGDVFALVALTAGRRSHNDPCGLYYKDMEESMGPYYYDCPKGILRLLTPTEDERAIEWRKQCEKRIAEKAAARKNGVFVPNIPGIEFTNMRQKYVVSSAEYRSHNWYSGVGYAKRHWKSPLAVIRDFVNRHGTEEQKAAIAAFGED